MNTLLNLSTEEFVEALRKGLGLAIRGEEEVVTQTPPEQRFVYGLKGLAKLLGCSRATAARIKKSGVINAATSQVGKIIVIDSEFALELLRISNPKKYEKTQTPKSKNSRNEKN